MLQSALCIVLCILFVLSANAQVARPIAHHEFAVYQKWLDEDVRWIITGEEKKAFQQLSTDDERDQFIDQFWSRRNPTPGGLENKFKEEHYRRLAYANEHFAARLPGWRTDRGHIYVLYGPPSQIETRTFVDSEGKKYPQVRWHYNALPGFSAPVDIDFVDACKCGEFEMQITDKIRQMLLTVPHNPIPITF